MGSLMPSGVNPDNQYVLDVTGSLETLTNAQAMLLAGYTHFCVCGPRDAPKLQLFFLARRIVFSEKPSQLTVKRSKAWAHCWIFIQQPF